MCMYGIIHINEAYKGVRGVLAPFPYSKTQMQMKINLRETGPHRIQ